MLSQTEEATIREVPWTARTALALWVAAFFGSAVWVTVLITLGGTNGELPSGVPWLFAAQIPLWTVYGVGPFLIARRSTSSLVDQFALWFKTRDVVVWAFAGLASQIVLIPLVYVPLQRLIDTDTVGDAAEDLIDTATTRLDAALLFVMIVVIAPVVEEIFYRGFVQPALSVRWGTGVGVVGSSIWFAASHLQPIQFPGLLVIGLVLAICRVRSGSLIPAIGLHMAFNGVTYGVLVSQLELS